MLSCVERPQHEEHSLVRAVQSDNGQAKLLSQWCFCLMGMD